MNSISVEFCLATLLLVSIFFINTFHILYLILSSPNSPLKPIRSILLNISITSLIISIWLIPFFYFRLLWFPESFVWRLWSYIFHVADAVQIYSLLLLLIIPSRQCPYICFVWTVPIIGYSPLLWLPAASDSFDYLPYRLFTVNAPWWVLVILYTSMYLMPLITAMICGSFRLHWSRNLSISRVKNLRLTDKPLNEHDQDMAELTSLVKTVLNFHLSDQSHKEKKRRKFHMITVCTDEKRLYFFQGSV